MLTRVLRGVPLDTLDGRSAIGVALRRTREELLDHLGGEDDATAPERILVDECAKLRIIAASVGDWLLRQETLVQDGSLIDAVEAHSRLVNNLGKLLRTLGLKRAARELTVADELQAMHRQRPEGAQ